MADTGVDLEAAALNEPVAPVDSSGADEFASAAGDNKRKLDDLEPRDEEDEAPLKKQEVMTDSMFSDAAVEVGFGCDVEEAPRPNGEIDGSHTDEAPVAAADDTKADDVKDTETREDEVRTQESTGGVVDTQTDPDQPQEDEVNDSVTKGDQVVQKLDLSSAGNGQLSSAEGIKTTSLVSLESGLASCKIEVPNSKVGVLIGKSGDTIKSLQHNSGARIQIARDAQVDPHSSTRLVELIGTPVCIDKAEKLIKNVIAEAETGGSPSLVARGFGTLHSRGDQIEIRMPIEKATTTTTTTKPYPTRWGRLHGSYDFVDPCS